MSAADWLLFQLSDSALPAGGFAHSSGLEAAWQQGCVDGSSLESFLRCQIQQVAHAGVPFLVAAYDGAMSLAECDFTCDAMLSNHVANRASRAQGKALVLAVSRIFAGSAMVALARDVRQERLVGHLAPIFGAICRELEVERVAAVRLFLFVALRGLVSAAVRLGIVGPLEAQAVQWRVAAFAEKLVVPATAISMEHAAQTAPLLDLLQGTQDRLYSRLFQS